MASPWSSPPGTAQMAAQMGPSSSTGLPSPHELVREQLRGLKSGSKALGTFSSAKDLLYEQRRAASDAHVVRDESTVVEKVRQCGVRTDKVGWGKLTKPMVKAGRASTRRTSDVSIASCASSSSNFSCNAGTTLDITRTAIGANSAGPSHSRSKAIASIRSDVYAIGDDNVISDGLTAAFPVKRQDKGPTKQVSTKQQLVFPEKSKQRNRKVRTEGVKSSSRVPSKATRKLSSTQVLDSDSPEPERSPPQCKKLSSTQVLNSDDAESDAGHAVQDAAPSVVRSKRPRQSLDAAMQSWKADKVLRHERKNKRTIKPGSGVKRAKARKPPQPQKQEVGVEEALLDGPETSRYFASRTNPSVPSIEEPSRRKFDGQGHNTDEEREDSVVDTLAAQPDARRRDWTPVKDTTAELHPSQDRQASDAAAFQDEAMPISNLKTILESFNYHHNATSPPLRVDDCEPPTKRRRVDFADQKPTVGKVCRRKGKSSTPKTVAKKANEMAPKKKRSAAKKAQTITALATAAYLPIGKQQDDLGMQPAMFTHLAPRADENQSALLQQRRFEGEERAQKAGKIRSGDKPKPNPKAKKATKAVKNAKPKKPKVKFDQPDPNRILVSPEKANSTILAQGFLFGTSSQLAIDDSPSFIRQCQEAIGASEKSPTTAGQSPHSTTRLPGTTLCQPGSEHARSKIRVPTAPHGTSLSCGQAERELWCVATRDDNAGLLVDYNSPQPVVSTFNGTEDSVRISRHSNVALDIHDVVQQREKSIMRQDDAAGLSAIHEQLGSRRELEVPDEPSHRALPVHLDEIIDLCDTSSIARSPDDRFGLAKAPDTLEVAHVDVEFHRVLSRSVTPEMKNDWVFLGSDEPPPLVTGCSSPVASHFPPSTARSWQTQSPCLPRFALQPLNANATMNFHSLAFKDTMSNVRQFSSSPQSGVKKKSSVVDRSTVQSHQAPAAARHMAQSSPAKCKRGRPRKNERVPVGKETELTPKTKRPLPSSKAEVFMDIDDISDAEAQVTPSPPRRQASCASPAMEPLPLTVLDNESAETSDIMVPAAHRDALKADERQSSSILRTLFPQITATIKAAPPSNNTGEPNWHEKMLLYDPIVIEDLTAWLNKQGVRCEVLRAKPKPKKRPGRPKKDVGNDGAKDVESEAAHNPRDSGVVGRHGSDVEVCKEELKPWMVQKWCEETSVCCYSRDGIRGGWNARHKSY